MLESGVDWLICAIETLRFKEEEKARADLLSADLAKTIKDASQAKTATPQPISETSA